MWFNNRFNKNNTIHFEVSEWVNTDPDNGQFCRKISDTEFEYIQVKNMNGKPHSKRLLEVLNDKTKVNDWYQEEIDVADYTEEEIDNYVSPYGDILKDCKGAALYQLIAECIFETDVICGFCD